VACSVADYFIMPALRLEALCLLAQRAEACHLPLLNDLSDSLNMQELAACIAKLCERQSSQAMLCQ
jgi:hypothetical protein